MTLSTQQDSRFSRLQSALKVLTDRFSRWRDAHRTFQDLRDTDPQEMRQMARDVGLSTDELTRLAAKGPNSAALLSERLTALHLQPDAIATNAPALMQDMQRLCSLCSEHGRCRRDLKRDPNDPVWKSYCPNEPTLDALQRQA